MAHQAVGVCALVDGATDTGVLDLIVGGQVETTYTFDEGIVTLSERENDATVTFSEFETNVDQISDWFNLCKKYCTYILEPSDYSIETEFEVDKIKYKVKMEATTLIDVSHGLGTKMLTFKARPEIELDVFQFEKFVKSLRELQSLIGV